MDLNCRNWGVVGISAWTWTFAGVWMRGIGWVDKLNKGTLSLHSRRLCRELVSVFFSTCSWLLILPPTRNGSFIFKRGMILNIWLEQT